MKIIHQIVKAIEYIHSHNVLHRDIKPENILIDKNFNAIICDFGFARKIRKSQLEKRKTVCGTKEYMSPEILK